MINPLAVRIKKLRQERGWTQEELAKRSGLDRGYIANLEGTKSIKSPSAETFLKLAHACNIPLDELYRVAGYIKGHPATRGFTHKDTLEEILGKLKLAAPISIPVYTDFPFHAGEPTQAVEYLYRERNKTASDNIEAYICRGNCMEPKINDGDIIIVDRDAVIDHGDIVACLADDELRLGQLKRIANELWLENSTSRMKFNQCQVAATVIEVVKRLK